MGDRRKLDRQAEQQGTERDFHPVSNHFQTGNTRMVNPSASITHYNFTPCIHSPAEITDTPGGSSV